MVQSVVMSLRCMVKNEVGEHEVNQWSKDRSRCNIYGKHFLSVNSEKGMGRKMPTILQQLDDVVEYPYVNDEILGAPS